MRNLKSRKLSFETLENRELLSANPFTSALFDQPEDYNKVELCSLPVANTEANIQATAQAAAQPQAAALLVELGDTFKLHSNPDSHFTIYLDFNGHTTSGTYWNTEKNLTEIITPAFSLDNDPNFSNAELERIQYIWQRVAEDFMPFDVDVTTEEPDIDRLIKTTGGSDTDWGIRVVIGGSWEDWLGKSAGGVAYVTSFNWDSDTPAFVFSNDSEKFAAEAISHEVGHTLGLSHDGTITNGKDSYYAGANGWAPIMGSGYLPTLVQWSKGEYADANEKEDDLAIITGNNGFTYRNDDHGNTTDTATLLTPINNEISVTGIIEQNTDVDYFSFTLNSDMFIDFNIIPGTRDANLDVLAKLFNSEDTLLYTSDPQDTLSATFPALLLQTGTYYLTIEGTGKAGVYSDYGSLGFYTIKGYIAAYAVPKNFKKTSVGKDSITLEWSSVANATGYTIQYSTDQNQWTTINNIAGTNYTISGLESSSYQYIRVRAEGNNGSSIWAESILVRVDDRYESNDSLETAYDLGVINGPITFSNLVYSGVGYNYEYNDYYKFTLPVNLESNSKIELSFAKQGMDILQLQILSVDGSIYIIPWSDDYIYEAEYTSDYDINNIYHYVDNTNRQIPAGTYIIRVFGSSGLENPEIPNYTLKFEVPTVATQPFAPKNFNTTTQTSNSVTLTWDAQSNLTGYTLLYKKSTDSNWTTWTPAPDISATIATITGLDASTQYNFKLTAKNSSGSVDSATVTITTAVPPSVAPPIAPENFKTNSQTYNSVTLKWDAQDNLTGYELLYKKSADPNWTTWTSAPTALATTATITGLDASTQYEFQLVAKNVSGDSNPSTTSVTTAVAPPIVPQDFKSNSQTHNSVTLEWTRQENLTGYELLYKKSADLNWTTWTAPDISATTATIIGLDASTQYDFKLTAKNTSGSADSNLVTVTTAVMPPIAPPVAPENFNTTGQTYNSVTLKWDTQENLTGYELLYKKSADLNWTTWTPAPDISETTVTITGLDADTLYDFCINATNELGTSANSTVSNIKTLEQPSAPIPQNLRSTSVGKTTTMIEWNKNEGETNYTLQRKTDSGNWETIYEGNDSQYAVSGLTAGATYLYRIQANGSEFSDAITVTTTAAEIKVADVPAVTKTELDTTGEKTKATLEWTDLGNDYSYYVFRNGSLVSVAQDAAEYVDNNAPETVRYLLYAYQKSTGRWGKSLPIVLSSSSVKSEIVNHTETAEGGITLNWNIPDSQQFVIFRNGIPVSGNVSGQSWTDTQPRNGDNQYTLYVNYYDQQSGRYVWTYSKTYVVQKPANAQAAALPENFWSVYDIDLIDDVLIVI
jgi:hypothetical protein